ncbi:MAG: hypothetical protein ACLSH6_06575 [Limosilactobacillus pontis]
MSTCNRKLSKYTQRQVIQAKRGTIYDAQETSWQVIPVSTLYAVVDRNQRSNTGKPLYVTNKKKTARFWHATSTLRLPRLKILTTNHQTYQVEFGAAGSHLSVATMQKIKVITCRGSTLWRPRPDNIGGQFASQLIGMANLRQDPGGTALVGQLGLEGYFNKQLTGINGIRQDKQDVYGYQLANSKSKTRKLSTVIMFRLPRSANPTLLGKQGQQGL